MFVVSRQQKWMCKSLRYTLHMWGVKLCALSGMMMHQHRELILVESSQIVSISLLNPHLFWKLPRPLGIPFQIATLSQNVVFVFLNGSFSWYFPKSYSINLILISYQEYPTLSLNSHWYPPHAHTHEREILNGFTRPLQVDRFGGAFSIHIFGSELHFHFQSERIFFFINEYKEARTQNVHQHRSWLLFTLILWCQLRN